MRLILIGFSTAFRGGGGVGYPPALSGGSTLNNLMFSMVSYLFCSPPPLYTIAVFYWVIYEIPSVTP